MNTHFIDENETDLCVVFGKCKIVNSYWLCGSLWRIFSCGPNGIKIIMDFDGKILSVNETRNSKFETKALNLWNETYTINRKDKLCN